MYAKDLAGTPVGTAVYHPIEMRAFSARVGDIAFFDENGKYQWPMGLQCVPRPGTSNKSNFDLISVCKNFIGMSTE